MVKTIAGDSIRDLKPNERVLSSLIAFLSFFCPTDRILWNLSDRLWRDFTLLQITENEVVGQIIFFQSFNKQAMMNFPGPFC